jgi:hypothetical protein
MDDNKKEVLKSIASLAEDVSNDHQHPCGIGEMARSVRDAANSQLAAGGGPAQVST